MRFSIVVLFSALTLVACASAAKKDPPGPTTTTVDDAGNVVNNDPSPNTDPGTSSSSSGDVTPVDAGPHSPTNQAECITACEAAHPTSAALSHKLDATCYLAGVCEPVCNNVPPGKNFPPTNDADAAAPVACPGQFAEGVDPIMTPSAECSTCLANTPDCCKLWVDIFGSADGRALNKCAVKCFTDFKN